MMKHKIWFGRCYENDNKSQKERKKESQLPTQKDHISNNLSHIFFCVSLPNNDAKNSCRYVLYGMIFKDNPSSYHPFDHLNIAKFTA